MLYCSEVQLCIDPLVLCIAGGCVCEDEMYSYALLAYTLVVCAGGAGLCIHTP